MKKLMNVVSTRWNSMYSMLERMAEQEESVLVSLASLKSDIPEPTTDDYKIIGGTLVSLLHLIKRQWRLKNAIVMN